MSSIIVFSKKKCTLNSCSKSKPFKLVSHILIYSCVLLTYSMKTANAAAAPMNGAGGGSASGNGDVGGGGGNGVCTSTVAHLFEAKGIRISPSEIPKEPIKGINLRYCEVPATGTCCTFGMEHRLADAARIQLEKQTKESIGKLASILGNRAQKFNDYFKELLAESKKEFHTMFKKTYGSIYEQNSYVFSDLFTELEKYYARGKVDLSEAMDSFFNTLYQKMFTVLNSQFTFDDKYLVCVSEHMKQLKPFGDVPDKLSVQIKRSFVATRTYAQSLTAAADIVRNMMNIKPNLECITALTRMQQCGICNGHGDKPCANYCVNVMKGCLQYYTEVDHEWDNFVSSIDRVSERLLGPFNVVMVVEPINIKISEAIMNFQETNKDISGQVFQGCGRPILGRRRRDTNTELFHNNNNHNNVITDDDDGQKDGFMFEENMDEIRHILNKRSAEPANQELQYEPLRFSNNDNYNDNNEKKRKKNKKKQQLRKGDSQEEEEEDVVIEPVLDKLIRDIRQKIKDTKKFWSNLPFQICNNEDVASTPANTETRCWNGHAVDLYPHPIVTDSKINPEFPNPSTKRSVILDTQLYTLRTSINQLRNAYNGLDVEWSDQEESEYGSGSGSGNGIEEEEHGSGLHPYDFDADMTNLGGGRNELPSNRGSDFNSSTNVNSIDYNSGTGTGAGAGAGGSGVAGSGDDDNTRSNSIDNNETYNSSGTTSTTNNLRQMSFRRAFISYVLPIFMAWFGGLFSELL